MQVTEVPGHAETCEAHPPLAHDRLDDPCGRSGHHNRSRHLVRHQHSAHDGVSSLNVHGLRGLEYVSSAVQQRNRACRSPASVNRPPVDLSESRKFPTSAPRPLESVNSLHGLGSEETIQQPFSCLNEDGRKQLPAILKLRLRGSCFCSSAYSSQDFGRRTPAAFFCERSCSSSGDKPLPVALSVGSASRSTRRRCR